MAVRSLGESEAITDTPRRELRVLSDHELLNLTWFRYAGGERGADPHIHEHHTDAFYVLSGEVTLGLGPELEEVVAPAGALVLVPSRVVHSFWNAGPSEARFLNVHAPGCGFVEYLRSHTSFDQHDPPEDGGRPASDAVVCGPGDGEVLELGPNRLLIKAGGDDADGAFYAGKMTIAPGFSGPPPHFHEHTLDSFFVLEGTLTVQIEGETVEVPAGSCAVATPGTVHTFSNPGADFVRAINIMGPGGFERHLKEAAAAGTVDPAVVGEILTRYDFVAA